eukprot:g2394.t1
MILSMHAAARRSRRDQEEASKLREREMRLQRKLLDETSAVTRAKARLQGSEAAEAEARERSRELAAELDRQRARPGEERKTQASSLAEQLSRSRVDAARRETSGVKEEMESLSLEPRIMQKEWAASDRALRTNERVVDETKRRLEAEQASRHNLERKVEHMEGKLAASQDELEIFRHLDLLDSMSGARPASSVPLAVPDRARGQGGGGGERGGGGRYGSYSSYDEEDEDDWEEGGEGGTPLNN